jgi:hypothetical protein
VSILAAMIVKRLGMDARNKSGQVGTGKSEEETLRRLCEGVSPPGD